MRRAVAGLEGADRAEQVAVDRHVGVAGLGDREERVDVDAHPDPLPLRVRADPAHRPRADPLDEPLQRGARLLAAIGAARPPRAHERVRPPRRLRQVPVGGIGARQRIGRVEHERPQPAGVVHGERLREVRAVGVAVHVDAPDPQRVQDVGEVVDRRARGEPVDPRAQLRGAAPGAADVVVDGAPQRLAVERRRPARAARVDEQQVAPRAQRPGEREVVVAAVGRRVARAALDVDDRPERWPVAVAAPVELEVDADLLARRSEPVERHTHGAAARLGRGVAAAVELRALGRLGRRRRDQHRQKQEQAASHRPTLRVYLPHERA